LNVITGGWITAAGGGERDLAVLLRDFFGSQLPDFGFLREPLGQRGMVYTICVYISLNKISP